VLFGLEENVLVLLTREFQAAVSDSGKVSLHVNKRHNCPGDDCPLGEIAIYLGAHDAIDRFRGENPDSYAVGLVKAVRQLVQLEIDDRPDSVGPPIDVLRITKDGPEWIEHKKECPNIQKQGEAEFLPWEEAPYTQMGPTSRWTRAREARLT
jgi:hypothetical protein